MSGSVGEYPLLGIAPVDGWSLWGYDEWDSDGFTTTGYCARKDGIERILNVSRFRFSPTQERFAYLVRNGFPPSPTRGPWSDAELDRCIEGLKV